MVCYVYHVIYLSITSALTTKINNNYNNKHVYSPISNADKWTDLLARTQHCFAFENLKDTRRLACIYSCGCSLCSVTCYYECYVGGFYDIGTLNLHNICRYKKRVYMYMTCRGISSWFANHWQSGRNSSQEFWGIR